MMNGKRHGVVKVDATGSGVNLVVFRVEIDIALSFRWSKRGDLGDKASAVGSYEISKDS